MPFVTLSAFGAGGLAEDPNSELLAPGQWSELTNVDFVAGELSSAGEDATAAQGCPIDPKWIFYFSDAGVGRIFATNGFGLYEYSNGVWITHITNWDGGLVTFCTFLGTLIVNSATNGPFYWGTDTDATWDELATTTWTSLADNPWNALIAAAGPGFTPLPGWFTNARCLQMVAYKNYLVALGLSDPARPDARSEYLYAWSASSPAGGVPAEWTPSTINDAGDGFLLDTQGAITGGAPMRDDLIIYKQDAIYRLSVGGTLVMTAEKLQGQTGIEHPGGVASLRGMHYLATRAGLVAFDGQSLKFLDFKRMQEVARSWLRTNSADLVSVVAYAGAEQIWFAQKDSSTGPYQQVLKYDLQHNSFTLHNYSTFRLTALCYGDLDASFDTGLSRKWIELSTIPWTELAQTPWGPNYNRHPSSVVLLALGGGVVAKYQNSGKPITASGVAKPSVATRHGLRFAEHSQRAILRAIYPVAMGTGVLYISVGKGYQSGSQTVGADQWTPPRAFSPGIDRRIPLRFIGDSFSLQITSSDGKPWRLASVGVEFDVLGDRG